MTDNAEIARIELCEALATLSDYIPGAEAFEKTSQAMLAVANAWYRAGAASPEPASS